MKTSQLHSVVPRLLDTFTEYFPARPFFAAGMNRLSLSPKIGRYVMKYILY